MLRYTLWLLLLSASLVVNAQTFTNIAFQQGIVAFNSNNLHGAGVSGVDFDQDGWDDLTFCLDGQIKTYRNNQGAAQLVDFGFVVDDNAKHPLWVDFDNDGDLDFYFTQYFHPNKLYRNDGGVFIDVTSAAGLPVTNVSTFGASWGDYDNDGDLDLYECNYIYVYTGNSPYEWHNHLYRNNGDGTFSDVTIAAGVSDGISLSFQSIWSDVNLDGWLDLYVINDLELPNRLYMNTGTGIFIEQGSAYSADVGAMDAMTIAAGDYNNDGKEDFFITNTSIGQCALLRNEGNGFTNVAASANVTLSQLTWGAVWFDQDLDMDLDLYVCENNYNNLQQPNPFLRNNGSGFFTNAAASTFPFDVNDSYSVTKFDWNNDGYLDLAVSNFDAQNAALWRCNTGNKNWVKFALEGVVSNTFGIGSRIELWCGGVKQSAQQHCGESYLGQPTLDIHFGLSTNTVIDSMKVHWPSGYTDVLRDLEVNTKHYVVEGQTFTCQIIADVQEICGSQPAYLTCGDHASYVWNDSTNLSEMVVFAPGEYSVTVLNQSGLSAQCSTTITLNEKPYFEVDVSPVSCANGSNGAIEVIFSDENFLLQWNDGSFGNTLGGLSAGWVNFTIEDSLLCVFSDSLFIEEPLILNAIAETTDVLCYGDSTGSVSVFVSGGIPPYTLDFQGINLNALPAGDYDIFVVDNFECNAQLSFVISEPEPIVLFVESIVCADDNILIDISTSGGQSPYEWWWSNGSNYEDLQAPEGIYSVVIIDSNDCATDPFNVECPTGIAETETPYSLFPNPTSGFLELNVSRSCVVAVYALCGELVFTTPANGEQNIDLSHLADGVYLFQISDYQHFHMFRVLKSGAGAK
ncbi:MAG: T9SS type A sorting domain-containing protein [Cryomorphaceae bacterium]|nr:T9SS type A sorting domain-containing protein [Cryomorphaceae bacterium]